MNDYYLTYKRGDSIKYVSHLDFVRVFGRAFRRAELPIAYSEGFNPHPLLTFALPLSVGVESLCEILDFELEDESLDCRDIMDRLNASLIDGIRVTAVYENGAKIKHLKYLKCEIEMNYDYSIPDDAEERVIGLFQQSELWMEKKGKSGVITQNIIPMIQSLSVARSTEKQFMICAVVSCQEPSLNPAQIGAAVAKYLPDCEPNYVRCRRCELYDVSNQVFR